MRKYTTALVIAAALAAAIAAIPALYAEDNQTPSGPMIMGDDNNGGGMTGMMKQMSQMMDHCSNMMSESRPNEQWRKKSPSQPEKKG